MKDISIRLSARSLVSIFKRFHLTFFIIFIAAILSGVVLLINNVVLNPPETNSSPTTQNQPTTDDTQFAPLRSLHTSDEITTPPSLPEGKVNPFSGG